MATYGGISKLYIIYISIYLFFCFTDKVHGKKTEQSDVATYGGISKLYIIQICIYLFFCFTDKVRGTEQSGVATYGGRIHLVKLTCTLYSVHVVLCRVLDKYLYGIVRTS